MGRFLFRERSESVVSYIGLFDSGEKFICDCMQNHVHGEKRWCRKVLLWAGLCADIRFCGRLYGILV